MRNGKDGDGKGGAALFFLLLCLVFQTAPAENLRKRAALVWDGESVLDLHELGHYSYWLLKGLPPQGLVTYEAEMTFLRPADPLNPPAFFLTVLPSAYEVYWNGKLIGRNGMIGATKETEKPGFISQTLVLPPDLAGAGTHRLQIRVSNHHAFTGGLGRIRFGELQVLTRALHRETAVMVFLAGIILIGGLFHLSFLSSRERRGHALFSLFCLLAAVHILRFFALRYLPLSATRFDLYMGMSHSSWLLILVTLSLFFLSEFFPAAKKRWFLLGAALAALSLLPLWLAVLQKLPPGLAILPFRLNQGLGFAFALSALALAVLARRRKVEGSTGASLGLLSFLVGLGITQATQSPLPWAFGLAVLVFLMSRSLTRRFAARDRVFRESQLLSARLEIELLKKNIQPRFLLGSLGSIAAWLGRDPKTAARLVNALASELRLMLKMGQEKWIPLAEEVKLCEAHLQVRGLREGRLFDLRVEGVSGEERFPPMVLQTLLDRGLDEAPPGNLQVSFSLRGPKPAPDSETRSFPLPSWMRSAPANGGAPGPAPEEEGGAGKSAEAGPAAKPVAGSRSGAAPERPDRQKPDRQRPDRNKVLDLLLCRETGKEEGLGGPEPGNPGEGPETGLRYVEARLEEAFPGRWKLAFSEPGEPWCARLQVSADR